MLTIFDETPCLLGEGPLWHPRRQALFWFDILGKTLHARGGTGRLSWQFGEHVSAAGWVDDDRLLIASETALLVFDLETGASTHLCDLEADNPVTRSNDGRADPFGGFWIGTMGKAAEKGAGAIYRWYRGELRRLYDGITISNAICFSPDGKTAYYTDTVRRVIRRQALDGEGWPVGDAETHIDLRPEGLNPDGAVVDAEGCLWNAQWGAGRVARYDPAGRFLSAIELPATQVTCPAFGEGVLYVTSAAHGAPEAERSAGLTFALPIEIEGQAEHRVIL